MTVYVELGDYCEIAAELLGTSNHPLPDGNKRAAFLLTWLLMHFRA